MRLPVTPLGWVTGAGAAVGGSVGWWLGWIEFVAVGLGCLLVLFLAVPFILGRHELRLSRALSLDRVGVGERAESILTIENTGSRKSAPRIIADSIASSRRLIDVPALRADQPLVHRVELPTGKRGVLAIGPAEITKGDPLGVLRRSHHGTGESRLWVHPRFTALAPLRSGFVKDLEGPTLDTSPAGDVAFHTIRQYVHGDDVRHIHWMSTARVGTLMIRHYVDNRRPYLGVYMDSRPEAMNEREFEIALEAAASMVVSAALESRPIALWVGDQEVVTENSPADRNEALDRLCLSRQAAQSKSVRQAIDTVRRVDAGVSAVVLLTGSIPLVELLPTVVEVARDTDLVVARCSEERVPATSLPRAALVDFSSLDEFAATWRGLVR